MTPEPGSQAFAIGNEQEKAASGRLPVPNDPRLPGLSRLFDREWAWQTFCQRFGAPDERPDRLRLDYFLYQPRARAVVGYVTERQWEDWVVEEQFAFELLAGQPERLFRYPDDPYLPGLALAAAPLTAHDLVRQHVGLHPQRLIVEAVRYRPTRKAVLKYHARWGRAQTGSVPLYARVMPSDRVAHFIAAGTLVERSGFVIPRLAGSYGESGIVWLANVPGETMRVLIPEGTAPGAGDVLDCLAPLWEQSAGPGKPMDVRAGVRHSQGILSAMLPGGASHLLLRGALAALVPFAESWRPTCSAHNDFYDDQLIVTPDGRLALVDFEEAGPGDPLLDVGTMLAHMDWMGRFNRTAERYAAYGEELRACSLERFGWDPRELALRESYALFRLASNPVRHLGEAALTNIEAALALAVEALAK